CPEPWRATASAYSARTAPFVAASTRRSGSAPVRAGGVRPAATTTTSAVTSSGECATSRSGACSSYASTRSARSPCTARPDAPPARPTSWSRAVGGSTRRSTICVHTCRPTSPVAPTTATSTLAGYDAPEAGERDPARGGDHLVEHGGAHGTGLVPGRAVARDEAARAEPGQPDDRDAVGHLVRRAALHGERREHRDAEPGRDE